MYSMKYFIIIPVFGTLVHAHGERRLQLRNLYRDSAGGFKKDLEATKRSRFFE